MTRLAATILALAAVLFAATSSRRVAADGQSPAAGTIRGRVMLRGAAPGNPIIRMGADPKCGSLNAGHRVIQESAVVSLDGGVANAFVRLDGTFPATPAPSAPVVIDQRACVYAPRVVGVRVGQVLRVKNSDDLLHNVHSSSAVGNSFNVGQPKAGLTFDFTPAREETMVKLGCDLHRWMTAYVGVVAHPYFAVSGAGGSFEMAGVPAGTYGIRTWHERFGELKRTITVKAGAVATIDLSYDGATVPPR